MTLSVNEGKEKAVPSLDVSGASKNSLQPSAKGSAVGLAQPAPVWEQSCGAAMLYCCPPAALPMLLKWVQHKNGHSCGIRTMPKFQRLLRQT